MAEETRPTLEVVEAVYRSESRLVLAAAIWNGCSGRPLMTWPQMSGCNPKNVVTPDASR
jgi:hypothetical protein